MLPFSLFTSLSFPFISIHYHLSSPYDSGFSDSRETQLMTQRITPANREPAADQEEPLMAFKSTSRVVGDREKKGTMNGVFLLWALDCLQE